MTLKHPFAAQVEGTLAKQILSEPDEVKTQDGRSQPRRCTVVSVSFSAHVDFFQNLTFVEATMPDNIVLVRATQGCFNCTSTRVFGDRLCQKKHPPFERP